MSKVYKVGDSVTFRLGDETVQGDVTQVFNDSYMVKESETEIPYLIRPKSIVELEQLSADASDALERIAKADRARADLLMHLLGCLSYYAGHGGEITYRCEYSQDITTKPLSELVEEYLAKVGQI